MDWYRELLSKQFSDTLPGSEGPQDPWAGCTEAAFHDTRWATILAKKPLELLPTLPNAQSPYRAGLAQWDAIAANGASSIRGGEAPDPKNRNPVEPVRRKGFNTWWADHVWPKRVRREKFSEPFAKKLTGRLYGDIVEPAHCLTHLRMDDKMETRNDLYLHGRTAFDFLKACAELFVAQELGRAVNWAPDVYDGTIADGLFVYPDIRMNLTEDQPEARLPFPSKDFRPFDKVTAVVLVVIELGPDPRKLLGLRESPLDDWWSYQPTSMYVAGWETAAWMSLQRVRPGKTVGWSDAPKFEFVSPVNDLLPPQLLKEWVRPGMDDRQYLTSVVPLKGLMEHRTPMFPCNSCLCYTGDVEDGLRRPKEFKPKTWKDDKCEEWLPYKKALRLAMSEVDKAKKRYYGRGNYVQNRAARKRAYQEYLKESIDKRRRRNRW